MAKLKSLSFQCDACKKKVTLAGVSRCRAKCRDCSNELWTLHADYEQPQQFDDGLPDGILATVLSLLFFGSLLIWYFRASRTTQKTTNSFAAIYGVHGDQLRQLLLPRRKAKRRISAFIQHREREIQRERMEQNNAVRCLRCNVLFVPSTDKPWTLTQTCSRVCCTAMCGADNYGDIESKVGEATEEIANKLIQQKKADRRIAVQCNCGHKFTVAQMYQGSYRKCPSCGTKLLVNST